MVWGVFDAVTRTFAWVIMAIWLMLQFGLMVSDEIRDDTERRCEMDHLLLTALVILQLTEKPQKKIFVTIENKEDEKE